MLSERILDGAFQPGHRLRESGLADELGVSRNTVREAVRTLELGGLVRYEVNRGAVVIAPTAESVDALYTARERLETAAAAREATPEQLAAIEEAMSALRSAAQTRDVRAIVEHDLALHASIVALLGSSRLDRFYADFTRELRFYLMVLSVADSEFDEPDALIAEHEAIVEPLRAGDRSVAVDRVRAHIETNAQRLRQILS